MSSKKNILISSTHRSGSSWLGKLLGSSDDILVRDEEIFSASGSLFCKNSIDPYHSFLRQGVEINRVPYVYVCKKNELKYGEHVNKIITNNFSYLDSFSYIMNFKTFKMSSKKKIKSMYRRFKNFERQIFIECGGLFSLPWIAKKYNMDVVLIIRHPASFVYSLKIIDSRYDFRKFFDQKYLMEDVLYNFKLEIQNPPQHSDIIGQGILLWRITNYIIRKYQKKYRNWTVIRLEDLNSNPIGEIKELYNNLDLNYTSASEAKIVDYSSSKNSSDDREAGFVNDRRNSKEMIKIWKKLSSDEILQIKDQTKDIWKYWYNEKDWQ